MMLSDSEEFCNTEAKGNKEQKLANRDKNICKRIMIVDLIQEMKNGVFL